MGLVGVVVLLGILIVGAWWIAHRRGRREERELDRLVQRHADLEPTTAPLGDDAKQWRQRTSCLPRGHRHNRVEMGVQGPLGLDMPGGHEVVDCAAFRWWWEQRGRQDNGRRYVPRSTSVVVARLPSPVPSPISVVEASVLGRWGVTRGGRQLESSEFNREFRVESEDDQLTLLLLDARLQQLLLEEYPGRSLELTDDRVVLVGAPSHRDDALRGFVGELSALRTDMQRLVATFPAQFWRALGADLGPRAASRPEPSASSEGPRHG